MSYNPWPIGQLPKALQRREPEMIRELGYHWTDAREIVTMFENKVAEFAGSKYAVAVDCCTHGLELSLRYIFNLYNTKPRGEISMPDNSYVSVYWMLQHLGFKVDLLKKEWSGTYEIGALGIIDGAVRWRQRMYDGGFHCLSFQIKKRIPIGRGGMVLTDHKEAADWIRLASYDGRDLSLPYDHPDHVKFPGYHYYMTPEDAARGLLLMHTVTTEGDSADWTNYPSIKQMLKL